LLLQPAAANCAALRTGTYRIVMPVLGAALSSQYGLATINASALSIARPDGSAGTLVANGACRFTDADLSTGYSADIVVSQAGVLLARYTAGGIARNFIGLPEQAHALADLAGNWNLAGMSPNGLVDVAVTGSATLNSAGLLSAVVACQNTVTWDVSGCVGVPDTVTDANGPWTADASGGFDVPGGPDGVPARVFSYRAGGGALMLAIVSQNSFSVWTPAHAEDLPVVGSATTGWNFDINPDTTSNAAVYQTTNVVDSVDAASKSWTRTHGNVGSPVTRVETVDGDSPRSGYEHRAAATVVASDGSTQNIAEFVQLKLSGMGVAACIDPGLKLFELAAFAP
jgi:hypothetical protein